MCTLYLVTWIIHLSMYYMLDNRKVLLKSLPYFLHVPTHCIWLINVKKRRRRYKSRRNFSYQFFSITIWIKISALLVDSEKFNNIAIWMMRIALISFWVKWKKWSWKLLMRLKVLTYYILTFLWYFHIEYFDSSIKLLTFFLMLWRQRSLL